MNAGTSAGRVHAEAVVVGSGAAGGWAAKVLSESGLDVLVLEAGPEAAPDPGGGIGFFPMVGRLLHYAAGKRRMQSFHPAYWGLNPNHFIDDRTEPFTTPPGRPFNWIRSRQLGGRTLLWGGVMLRMSDHELQAGSRQGLGLDWPVTYADLAPWYDRVEQYQGVFGTAESLPQLPDGPYIGSRPLTAGEEKLRECVEAAWPGRRVIPSRGIDGTLPPSPGQAWSRLTSVGSTLADALRTGRTRIQTNAIVSHLLPDGQSGRAEGVAYVDRANGERHEVHAGLVVLCASTISTLQVLLRTAARFPRTPLNDLPALGRYLMDHVSTSAIFSIGGVPFQPPQPRTGAHGFLIPRFVNLDSRQAAFRGGFGVWGAVQREGFSSGPRSDSAIGLLVAHGDMEPRTENRVTLGEGVDRWGLRIPHIDCSHSGNDRLLRAAMQESVAEMLAASGGWIRDHFAPYDFPGPWRIAVRLERGWKNPPPGSYAHEVGGARMGTDPGSSVVDPRNRVWGMPNVLVTDGACWPSSGWQNPTLTIMAVTHRACSLAAESLGRAGGRAGSGRPGS